MKKYPEILQKLIEHYKRLPGVGVKTAERYAFQSLEWKESDLNAFSSCLSLLKNKVQCCSDCGCYKDPEACSFCEKANGSNTLCIIAKAKDAYTIDRMNLFSGFFYVLGTLISPLDGQMPEDLPLSKLSERTKTLGISEIIIALDSTLEGDATALYLHKHFKDTSIKITKLALGIPMGSSLEYVDEGTLSQAFSSRHTLV